MFKYIFKKVNCSVSILILSCFKYVKGCSVQIQILLIKYLLFEWKSQLMSCLLCLEKYFNGHNISTSNVRNTAKDTCYVYEGIYKIIT